jgi:hypothetical protein
MPKDSRLSARDGLQGGGDVQVAQAEVEWSWSRVSAWCTVAAASENCENKNNTY